MRIIEGLRFSDGFSKEYIYPEENKIDEYVDYINKKNIKHLAISLDWGYKGKNIDFILKCPNIEYLYLGSCLIKDYSPVYSLKHLIMLRISIPNVKVGTPKVRLGYPDLKIDVSQIPSLEELYFDRGENVINLGRCKNLKKISNAFYNPVNKNLEELSNLNKLIYLNIYRSNINSLKGIGELNQLRYLFIDHFPNLNRLDELEKLSDNLVLLVIDGCKRVENFEYVSTLKNLKVLKILNCGNLPNIHFIKRMPNLKAFVFVGTNIVDGDLSPCIGLEYVGFLNKRHYSHQYTDFSSNQSSPETLELTGMN
jgi:protein phosphatase 1 regulatory subunit 7